MSWGLEAQLKELRAENLKLRAVLQELLSFDEIVYVCDRGPTGEGWQSDRLMAAIYTAQELVDKP